MLFAIRPESDSFFRGSNIDRGEAAPEAGQTRSAPIEGIDGSLGKIDPHVFGVDPSDFVMHSGSVGAGSGSKAGDPTPQGNNYPMSGAAADVLLSKASFFHAIRDQVTNGKTGAKLVHLFDDMGDYTEAFYEHSPEAQVYGAGWLEGEARLAARRAFSIAQTQRSPAFTNTNTGRSTSTRSEHQSSLRSTR